MKIGGPDSMECKTYLRNVTDLLSDGKTPYGRRFGRPFKGPIIPFGWVSSYNCEGPVKEFINLERKSYLDCCSDTHYTRGEFGRVTYWLQTSGVGNDGRIGNLLKKKTQCEKGWYFLMKKENLFSNRRLTNQTPWTRSRPENIHLDTAASNSRRKSHWFSWRIRRVSSTTSRLVSGCRWSDKWFLVHVRKLHIPPSRWTQSQTLLAERRIIPYSSWNTLTYPELLIRIWMFKQEKRIDDYWNIDGSRDLSDHGQVPLSLLY